MTAIEKHKTDSVTKLKLPENRKLKEDDGKVNTEKLMMPTNDKL